MDLERESWRSLNLRILGRKVSTTIVVPRIAFKRVARFLNLPTLERKISADRRSSNCIIV